MSYIEKRLDGKYEVAILYQDGYDRADFDTKSEAIRAYKEGIRWLDGGRDPVDSIEDPVILDRTVFPVVVAEPPNGVTIDDRRIRDAVRLALSRQRLEVGSRYELQVTFVKVDGPEPYEGEGI